MDASVLEEKLSFKVLQLTFSSMLDWGSHIIFIGKTASIAALICSMNFFLLRLLYISINLPYGHACNTVVIPGLVHLFATWNCWIMYGNSFAASFEPLAHCQNLFSLILFYRYYFHRWWSKLAQLVPLPFSWGRSTCYSDRLHDF